MFIILCLAFCIIVFHVINAPERDKPCKKSNDKAHNYLLFDKWYNGHKIKCKFCNDILEFYDEPSTTTTTKVIKMNEIDRLLHGWIN